ncbi:hypothetical protein QL285_010657 [Trifolium repens]|nr:hypothetical protein QL285_010657 [Trifolium repens]
MYEISHKRRNGSYVNDEAPQKNEELQKERQTSSDNETFVTVFGKDHHGYVRGMGLGPTPSQINGSSSRPLVATSSSTYDAKITKMQSEIDVLTKEVAEVNELKAKVAEFDAMKEQFVVIMANMQNHLRQYLNSASLSRKVVLKMAWTIPYIVAEVFSHGALEVYKYFVEELLQVSYAARLND